MVKRRHVGQSLRKAARAADMDEREALSLLCRVRPVLLPLLRELTDRIASESFVAWRWIVRGVARSLLGVLDEYLDRECES